jgi:hypothetical protein
VDDHREQLVRADQRGRRPRGHRRTGQAVPEIVSDVRPERRCDAQPEQPARGTGTVLRSQSSITIELA